jgi:5-hydroxyisourate hydrolase
MHTNASATDADGRCSTLLAPGTPIAPGMYKMTFFTEAYFEGTGNPCFYPLVEVSTNV